MTNLNENLNEKNVKVIYGLSEAGRKENLLAGGNGKQIQYLNVPATQELIGLSNVDADGNITLVVAIPEFYIDNDFHRTLSQIKSRTKNHQYCFANTKDKYNKDVEYLLTMFDSTQTIDMILQQYRQALTIKKELTIALVDINTQEQIQAEEEKKQLQKTNELAQKEQEEKERKEKAEKEKRKQEKTNWITAHGSQYLKDCLELGQYAHKDYVYERAEFEFPEYKLDYNNSAAWDTKYSPSQKALDELKLLRQRKIESDIVYLTTDVDGEEYDSVYDGDVKPEAVVIRNFLGKYDLIKIIE
jgi:hypothetical protein